MRSKLDEMIDEIIDSTSEILSGGFNVFLDGVEESLKNFPPELKINIITGIMIIKFSEYVVTIRDNNMALEAAGIKKQFIAFIEELDKTMVSEKDKPFVEKIQNNPLC